MQSVYIYNTDVVQFLSHRLLTAEAWVQSQGSQCDICCG
jgi:hypothetical protein